MLKDYPIRFDGEKIFTPTSWEEDSAVVESVNEKTLSALIQTNDSVKKTKKTKPCSKRQIPMVA